MPVDFSQKKLAPLVVFLARLGNSIVISGTLVFSTLLLGVAGYHWIARFDWVDSLLNASMILGGMGPANELEGTPAKLFASFYALFCGLVFVGAFGIMISPIIHRMMHKFHIDDDDITDG